MRADKQATLAKGFADYRSFVAPDGREVLYKDDWDRRKTELWERCGGRCEAMLEVIGVTPWRCTAEAADPHHVIRRSVKRDDRLLNLQALCRYHHDLLDERKIRSDRQERREAGQ